MRILHVLNDVEAFGNGIVHVAVDNACLQADAGHAVAVASAGGGFEGLLARHDVRHYRCRATPRTRAATAVATLARTLRTFRPDVVHCHMVTSLLITLAARVAKPDVRIVSTVHNSFSRSAVLMGLAHRVIAVSEAVAADMHARGVNDRKIAVIQNGPLASPRKSGTVQAQRQAGRVEIVTVAGMYERKGISELLTAFDAVSADFPEARLTLVGDGPDRARFEAEAAALDRRERIAFAGFASDPRPFLAGADIFVLASRADPSPLVIPEARSAGCAIIGTNVDGIPEALDLGEAGLIIEPGRPDAMAGALSRLLSDPALRERMQRQAARNLERFSAARVAEETLSAYRDAFGPRPSRR